MYKDADGPQLITREAGGTRTTSIGVGKAEIGTHFGEFLQGMFHMPWGPTRGLVTVPCPVFRSSVQVELTPSDEFRTEPPGLSKAMAAAKATLTYLGAAGCGATIRVESNIEQGIGAGSSTGDVVATIRATAAALRRRLTDQEVAVLTLETEKASDPTMFSANPGEVRLFAHRMGMTLELFEGSLPPLELVGVIDGAPVETLAHPPASYPNRTIYEFDFLLDGLRTALKKGDGSAFGEVATRSAEINQTFLPKPRFSAWMRLFQRHGAVGIAVSHSGSAVSFLFDRRDQDRASRIEDLMAELADLGVKPMVRYELGSSLKAAA